MFGWGTRKVREEVGVVAGFGKIPTASDFVRAQPTSDEMAAFEVWVDRAMTHAERSGGSAWASAFESGPTYGFIWCAQGNSKARNVLVGVLSPSRDAVGRRYPLALCLPLPFAPIAAAPHLLPLLLGGFLRRASDAAGLAAKVRTTSDFQVLVAGVEPPSLDAMTSVATSYSERTRRSPVGTVLAPLFVDGAVGAEHAVHTIVEATVPYRGRDAPPLHLAVRAPTGLEAVDAAAAWIDVVRAAAAWRENVPNCFFAVDGGTPGLLLHLGGDPPPSLLSDLWSHSPSDRVCVLEEWAPSSRLATPLPDSVTLMLQDGGAPFAALIEALERRVT